MQSNHTRFFDGSFCIALRDWFCRRSVTDLSEFVIIFLGGRTMVQTLEKGTEQKAAQTHDTGGAVQVSNTEQAAYQTQAKKAQPGNVSTVGSDGKMTIPPIQEAPKKPTNPTPEKSTDAPTSAGKVQPTDSK